MFWAGPLSCLSEYGIDVSQGVERVVVPRDFGHWETHTRGDALPDVPRGILGYEVWWILERA